MEILVAIDRLDDLLTEAKAIPLTGQVRLEQDRLRSAVEAIRAEADGASGTDQAGSAYAAVERLEAITDAAKAVPGSDQVRVDRDEVLDLLHTLREVLPAALATRVEQREPSPWDPVIDAVDEIETLMNGAGRTLTGKLKIDAKALRHAAARIRTVATQNVGPPDAASKAFYAAVEDLEALAHGRGTLKLPPEQLWGLLERMYLAMRRAVS